MIHFSSKYKQVLPGARADLRAPILGGASGQMQQDADKIVLSRFSPPGVIVNADLDILQFRGRTAPFIEPSAGQPRLNLQKMARPELLATLRTTIQSAKKENKAIERQGLHFESDGKHLSLDLEVIPIDPNASDKEKTFLVLFKERTEASTVSKSDGGGALSPEANGVQLDKDKQISDLMRELLEIRDYQQALIEQYEATQEELTSANEELQSTNEEFQSTNEEIETAKEELQSTNEELVTVNDELQMRNSDLTSLSSDLNNVLVSIDLPVLIVGGDQRIRRFSPNAKSAFNLIPSDVGRPLTDIRPSFDVDLGSLVAEVGETLSHKQIEIQDFNGSWLRMSIRPYKTIDNRIDGAIISLTDIDKLKKREKKSTEARIQADKANQAKDVFLATLSHELRTPLSSILTWAQLIAQGKVDFERARQGAAIIEQNAKAQNQIIADLLDISRIVIGKLAVDIQSIDPAKAIRSAIESVQPMAEMKSIKIDSILPSSREMIRADQTRLQQIVWNLLANAVKFSPKETKIQIELKYVERRGKRFAKIRVSDRGEGIPPEFLPYIFERFSQADESSTRAHGGLGLGLSIVQSLVELQSGTVKAENAGEGVGAIFTVCFPVISHQVAITKADLEGDESFLADDPKESAKHPPKLDGLRILIVDDDESAREAIGIYLKSFGAQVTSVGSAVEALEHFGKVVKPSIVVSDIAMPGESGHSLMRKIRSLDRSDGGDVPALALSAYISEEDTQNALAAGFQDCISKPVEATVLARLILKTLGQ
jgi:two-component system, chemotaxis family, CheB/CheR fusion protein